MEVQSQEAQETAAWLNFDSRQVFFDDLFDGLVNQDYINVDPKYILRTLERIEFDIDNFRSRIYGNLDFNKSVEPLLRHLSQIDIEVRAQTEPFEQFYYDVLFAEERTKLNFAFIAELFEKDLDLMAEILQPYIRKSESTDSQGYNKHLLAFIFINITLPLIFPNTDIAIHLLFSSAIVLNYLHINKTKKAL